MAPVVHRGQRFGATMAFQSADLPWAPNAAHTLAAISALLGEHVDRISRIVVHRSASWDGPGES
jgi:hypothetical protein